MILPSADGLLLIASASPGAVRHSGRGGWTTPIISITYLVILIIVIIIVILLIIVIIIVII